MAKAMQYANALIYCFVILLSSATWLIEFLEVFNHEWWSMSFPPEHAGNCSSVSLGSVLNGADPKFSEQPQLFDGPLKSKQENGFQENSGKMYTQ